MGLQNYEFQSKLAKRFIDEGRAEGEAQGRRATLVTILETRGLQFTEAQLQRIEFCSGREILERWARAAVTASSPEAVFDT